LKPKAIASTLKHSVARNAATTAFDGRKPETVSMPTEASVEPVVVHGREAVIFRKGEKMTVFKKFIKLVKVDEAKHTVLGIATSEVPDQDGEIADYAASKKAFTSHGHRTSFRKPHRPGPIFLSATSV
jgi:DNA-directed RNA polymerase beta subunit